ncbi:MAG: hypothetical protein U9O66_02760 [Patescibacteria group bacterium]|nr:hypothetical protein [Patescibacteria group bacterium]
MSKKFILKIVLIVFVVFILFIAFFWFFYNNQENFVANNNETTNKQNYGSLNRNNNVGSGVNQQNGEVNRAADFTIIANITAEKFGSYSSDTHNFENLRDMQDLMTDRMKQWTDDFIDNLSIDNSLPQEYYGVTTRALSVKIISHNEKQDVEVVVSCQKEEIKGRDNPISKIKYQDARIKMLYVNEKWIVDELQWE